jgi:maleate cis-trans isomerase
MKTCRAGLIVPWMNTALEDEISSTNLQGMRVHWARIMPSSWPTDSHDETYLSSMYADIKRARRSFTGISLDTVIIGCTSLSFARDTTEELALHARIEGWKTVQDTIIASWKRRNLAPTYLFGPYSNDILQSGGASLSADGVPIAGIQQIPFSKEIKDISQPFLAEKILDANLPAHSIIILSCTALYTMEIPTLLKRQGRGDLEVISSNLSIIEYLTGLASPNHAT